jgi:serine/threonine protein kinase
MPPEQWMARAVRASDQYALAIVVYQRLCGELPFRGTALEIMGQHIHTPCKSQNSRRNKIVQLSGRLVSCDSRHKMAVTA